MKAKKFLEQYSKNRTLILNKLTEIEQWNDMACRITSAMGGERVQTSGSKEKMADAVNECVSRKEEILNEVKVLIEIEKEITKTIEQLSRNECKVLHMAYIEAKDLSAICIELDRSYSWAKNVHSSGLSNLQKILNKSEGKE